MQKYPDSKRQKKRLIQNQTINEEDEEDSEEEFNQYSKEMDQKAEN